MPMNGGAGNVRSGGGVDAGDARMRPRGADEREVKRSRNRDVVHVLTLSGQEARVLRSTYAMSDDAGHEGGDEYQTCSKLRNFRPGARSGV
jgi:hypothetical protein